MKSIMLNLIFLSLSLPVMANTVKFEFSGYIDTINSNENNALGNVYLNQSFDGWFSYSSVADQYPSSATTGHYHQDASISVALGTQTLSYINDYVYIRVYDNYQGEDTFSFGVDASQGDFSFTYYGVRFSDSTGMVFNNDDLPMSFDLAQFDSSRLVIAGYKNWDWFDVGGEITNMTLIPEPARTYYVDAVDGNDNNDGLSLQTPFATIQKAIDSAFNGDTVLVADGTYTGPGNRDIDFLGKAITVRSQSGPENCIIDIGASQTDWHNAFYLHEGENETSIIEGFTIRGGYTYQGGAIFCDGSSPTIENCVITENTGGWGGGGAFYNSDATIINCLISGNKGWDAAGGIYCRNRNPKITNCTITGNWSEVWGGGVYCQETSLTVANCILWDNLPQPQISDRSGNSTISVTYSDVQGGWEGQANIDEDPCFVEPGYWVDANDPNIIVEPNDPNAIWIDGDYHLKSFGWRWDTQRKVWTWDDVTSRCIDAGNPGSPVGEELLIIPVDLNNEWGQNLRINMGAYGGTAEASMPPFNWALLADLTNDGIDNLKDYTAQAQYWLESESEQPGDLNRDGTVDIADLALLTEDWLEQTSWYTP